MVAENQFDHAFLLRVSSKKVIINNILWEIRHGKIGEESYYGEEVFSGL